MFTPRRSPRIRVTLPALLDYPSAEGPPRQLSAQTIDLSQSGIAIATPVSLPIGTPLRVAVEQGESGRRRVQRWLGRVVNVQEGLEGHRVGIEFLRPDAGPAVSIQLIRADGRHRQVRLDPAWDLESPATEGLEESSASTGSGGRSRPSFRVFQGVVLLGYLADQVSKAQAFRWVRTASRAREVLPGIVAGGAVKNFGAIGGLTLNLPLASEAFALVSLALTCVVARRALRSQSQGRWRPVDALGWGCLLAGMLGNTIDRLALGYVRDFLIARALPNWSFNLADVLAIGGTLLLLGSWGFGPWRREPAGDRLPATSTP